MDFNLKGYADFLEAKNSRLLIIDYDEKHKLAAYFPIGNHYRKVMTWKTPQDAEKSIYKLYTNTYYHGSNFYLKQIDKLEERFKPEEFLNINSLKEACYQLNQKALKIHNIIQEGARNFGCQCRFLLIKHRCLRLLNFYESNFNNHIWKVTSKTPLIYLNDNGKEEKGFTYDFEFRQLNAKEDIRIKENMFGVSIECSLRDGFLEDYVLSSNRRT